MLVIYWWCNKTCSRLLISTTSFCMILMSSVLQRKCTEEKQKSLTENDWRRWMRWCHEPRCRKIQSLTVRQIVPLATHCPFNFSACWLIAKEHCLSQRESNLACLPGYSSAKAPYNEAVLVAPGGRLLWCSYLPSFSWLAAEREARIHPLLRPSTWKLEQCARGNGKKWDGDGSEWKSAWLCHSL